MKSVLKWIAILAGCTIVAAVIGVSIARHDERQQQAAQADAAAGIVRPGMTPEQVRRAWGAPDSKNAGFYNGVNVEQWTYRTPARYVAFRDGYAVVANADGK